jgi:adenosine deaminase
MSRRNCPSLCATQGELRASQELAAVRGDPLALHVFLRRMPKGADLHGHLHSAVYAETLIRNAIDDKLCVDQAVHSFAKPQSVAGDGPVCGDGAVPAATAYKDQRLYDALMRGFVPSEGVTGHDHLFGAFKKFGGTDPSHTGDWLDEVANRAAAQNMQYLELMATPTWHRLDTITKDMSYDGNLETLRNVLLGKGLAEDIPAARQFWDDAEAKRRERERCETADATPGCKVALR